MHPCDKVYKVERLQDYSKFDIDSKAFLRTRNWLKENRIVVVWIVDRAACCMLHVGVIILGFIILNFTHRTNFLGIMNSKIQSFLPSALFFKRKGPYPLSRTKRNMTVKAPTKSSLQKAFEYTLSNSKAKDSLNLSNSEVNRLKNAFTDDEFTTLLGDYIQEISDPKNKAEKDLYLKQLEEQNDVPANKTVIHPKAGYVLKFKRENGDKIFVNIVQSEEIERPTSQKIEGKRGSHWSLPYMIGPKRYECDKKKKETIAFDVCFHTYTLMLGKSSKELGNLIVRTAKDAVRVQLSRAGEKVDIGADVHILKNVPYMNGSPSIMLLTKDECNKETGDSKIQNCDDIKSKVKDPSTGTDKSKGFGLKKGFLLESKKRNNLDSCPNSEFDSSKPIIPHFEVIERGHFDLIDHTMDGQKQKSTRPAFVEYRISLPSIKSSNQIDLRVMKQRIELSTSPKALECTKYSLCIPLPYPVIHDDGKAQFDTSLSKLVITLPVERQEKHIQRDNSKRSAVKPAFEEIDISPDTTHNSHTNSAEAQLITPEQTCSDVHSRWLESDQDDAAIHRAQFASNKEIPLKMNEEKPEVVNDPDEDKETDVLNDFDKVDAEKVDSSDVVSSTVTESSFEKQSEEHSMRKESISKLVFELD